MRKNNETIGLLYHATGTGKTYVFIKTMFELNKRYGWTKFIIVVPSIAIREGIKKSFDMTEDYFMEQYGKKIRNFIYDSKDLTAIDQFSSSGDIYVMIINTQAFNTSMKEGGRSKDARIIYSKRDDFGSRRPIDVIAANNPILILDEPQKMGGKATQAALNNFNPLFSLNYSATHRTEHNLIYVLDALDAYNKKLVKRIAVKGFELKNFRGTDEYLYLDEIILSSNKPPKARLHFEIKYKQSINREARLVEEGDNPNVFQICTLKHSDSQITKRQEVGRGLRICVNQNGDRMDKESLGKMVHDMNILTVIASDSYSQFVGDLQKDIKDNLYDRPTKATREYFFGKIVETEDGSKEITDKEASDIVFYLIKSEYIDNDFEVTDKYHKDLENGDLIPVPEDLKEIEEGIHYLVQAIFDENVLDKMIKNDHETKLTENELNDNFHKKEFQNLWNLINHKYSYKVKFDSEELIDKADEVVVYAKLPKEFAIPTPVGNYTPDWAIAFKEGAVKHIYFIAETKGSLDSMELRKIEEAKIDCARSLFNNISTDDLRYDHVTDYQSLLNIVK